MSFLKEWYMYLKKKKEVMFTHNFNQKYSTQSDSLAVDCLARQFTGKLTFALLCLQ